jgi:hypothetical protein
MECLPHRSIAMTPSSPSTTRPESPADQRDHLLDTQREANRPGARNFKDDALTDKVVSVEPDGTGPTSTETFDPDQDRAKGSGGPSGAR